MRFWGAILCALWCVAASVVIGVRVQGGGAFDTDIQNILPGNALEPVIRAAISDASNAASRRVVVLVSGADQARAELAAADLEREFTQTGAFASDQSDGELLARWLFANRNQLICETDPALFDGAAAARRSLALLYAPMTPISGELLARDPFLRTLQLAQCLARAAGASQGALVSGALSGSAFRIDVQDKLVGVYEVWRERWPDVSAARAGAVFFAEHGARQARREIALIGGVSLLAILALLFVCFRRPEAVLGTLAVTLAGGAGSLGAALLVFPSVHVLVFVFGSALIGVTSDYALHYLATGPQTGWAPVRDRIKLVSRPLAACALATATGFASLGLFGVAIFNQVAVFSVAGIVTAWWFTLTLLPLMDVRARDSGAMSRWWRKLEAPFLKFNWTRAHTIAAALLALVAIGVGALRYDVLDDVRLFQPRSPELASEEAQVRQALGFSASPSFLLSYGGSADQARQREEAALARWPSELAADVLAASRFDPSSARRAENEALLRRELYNPHLPARRALLEMPEADPLAPVDAAAKPAMLAALEGQTGAVHYLVAPLGAIAAAASPPQQEGAVLVDPAARYSQAFALFRARAAGAVAAAFLVCALIVLALYRTWRALRVLAAPALGVAMAVAVPLALGAPASFFSIAALFVVIGAGIDHSVFLFEAAETDDQAKELVVFLAALTTILSMGLLGLSGTFPVRSFGLAVAAGVTAAYLASFLPNPGPNPSKRGRAGAGHAD